MVESEAPEPRLCLALDVGGTKLAVGLVGSDGEVLFKDRTRTPRATDPEALYQVVADLVTIALEAARPRGEVIAVGVGCGGPMRGELVSPLNIPAWRDFPLGDHLRSHRGFGPRSLPVFIENDAKALALGEGWVGAARGLSSYLAMVVSTGVGGGIVLDGRLLDGELGNAGHIGHVIVEPGGRLCGCGARGCLEAEASGSAIEAITGAPAKDAPPEIVERSGQLVGRAVASVANLLDLRHTFIGGSVALGFGTSFFLAAQRELDCSARLSFSRGARLDPVGLGEDGPLVGAAAVGWRGIGELCLEAGR
jgi:glucokinase